MERQPNGRLDNAEPRARRDVLTGQDDGGQEHPVRSFWRSLDELRRERGLSYKQLERRTDVPDSTLQYWMVRSRRLAPWHEVSKVVQALGAPAQPWFRRWKQADHASVPSPRAGRNHGSVMVERPGEQISAPDLSTSPVTARAQLPMDIREFTGRDDQLRRLLRMLDPPEDAGATAVAVAAIEGMAGIGKTRLAVHAAHLLKRSSRIDDIQLYVDLRGHSPSQPPAEPGAVLEGFLRLLGVRGQEIPRQLEARAALYRDRLDRKRAIVLLDNAADEKQVRPLLPGSATCRVLITSRRKLAGLDGVQPLTLDVFSPDEALDQLARVIGTQRISAEPEAADEIVRRCGYLPLAVALAARRLQARPAWTLASLAERLSAEERRLGELSVSDRAVRAVFWVSYHHVPADQRRMFRLLGLHPGGDFTPSAAAALADTTPDHAERALEELLDEHLLEQTVPGRYRFHDLLQAYARERTEDEDAAPDRAAAVRRVLDWYLHTADRADRILGLQAIRFPPDIDRAPRWPPPFDTYQEALDWCEAERVNLVAGVRAASVLGLDHIVWRLPPALGSFFTLRKHWDDWIATYNVAAAAARRLGDRAGEAWVLDGLAIAYCEVHRFAESLDGFTRALDLRREIGDRCGEAQVLNNVGEAYRRIGRLDDAVTHLRRSLAMLRQTPDPYREGITLNNLGKVYRAVGRLQDGLDCHLQALSVGQGNAGHYHEAEVLNDLGDTYRSLGEFGEAIDYYRRTLDLRRGLGDRYGEAETLHSLGQAHAALRQHDEAINCYQQAASLRRDLGDTWGLGQTLEALGAVS